MPIDLILGTAGHIDHGKTRLIQALTGVDTDRLPEEKRRGITIDIGFAELALGEYRLGIVDVPGHERFVKNMLAGATGMDLALLVVAADDSVKPQTREHMDILRMLNLRAGVIALTKCDLAEPAWIDLVEEEVRELVRGSFLEKAPLERVSAVTGAGIGQLRSALCSAAASVATSERLASLQAPFRMPIDRGFTVAGHGTVVTGSVASGTIHVGDALAIEPGGFSVRVRGLQSHDRQVDEVHRGQRAAINLAGIRHDDIQRGQEATEAGRLRPSRWMAARLHLLENADRPVKQRARLRLHLGTAEIMSSISLLDRDELRPGESALAQFYLAAPAVATWGQPFVLRSESPVSTVGGGRIIQPRGARLRRRDERILTLLNQLSSAETMERAAAALTFQGLDDWTPADLISLAGIVEGEAICQALFDAGELVDLSVTPSRTIRAHRDALDEWFTRIESRLEHWYANHPRRMMAERSWLISQFEFLRDPSMVNAILEKMSDAGRLVLVQEYLRLPDRTPDLSSQERQLLEQLIQWYAAAGFQPPTVAEAKQKAARLQAVVPELLNLAAEEGRLVQVSRDFYFHPQHVRQLKETLTQHAQNGTGLTVSEIKDLLSTSRKYALPLCEFLDRTGFTVRDGDLRRLNV